jgi:hypothetical protein
MIGCYDFCGHYEWTFEWLRQNGGEELVRAYWDEAVHEDAGKHAGQLIAAKGIEGMKEYWSPTLADEGAVSQCTATDSVFRIDMHECPSKGFLLRNGLEQYHDYCDHCIGWIGPMLRRAGFVVDHQHNHCGQCWWEIRAAADATPPSKTGTLAGERDVRLHAGWNQPAPLDTYHRANDPDDKSTE